MRRQRVLSSLCISSNPGHGPRLVRGGKHSVRAKCRRYPWKWLKRHLLPSITSGASVATTSATDRSPALGSPGSRSAPACSSTLCVALRLRCFYRRPFDVEPGCRCVHEARGLCFPRSYRLPSDQPGHASVPIRPSPLLHRPYSGRRHWTSCWRTLHRHERPVGRPEMRKEAIEG